MSEGEVSVNYIAPLAASIRYGVTDNIESRVSVVGESLDADLLLHTHHDSSALNYGVLFGYVTAYQRKPNFYYGAIVSKKVNRVLSPYVTYISSNDRSKSTGNANTNYIGIGLEMKYPLDQNRTKYFIFTPEIGKVLEVPGKDVLYQGTIFSCINFGLSFNLY